MSKKKRNRSRRVNERSNNSSSLDLGRLGYWLQLILVFVVPFVLIEELNNYIDLPRGVLVQVAALLILLVWFKYGCGEEARSSEACTSS